MDDVSWIDDLLRRIARDTALYSDGRYISKDTLDSFETSLELAYVIETAAQLSMPQRAVCGFVCSAIHCKNEHVNSTMLIVILVAGNLEWILC